MPILRRIFRPFWLTAGLFALTSYDARPLPAAAESCGCEGTQDAAAQQDVLPISSDMARIHDPAIAKVSGTYYLFSTGRGIIVHMSKDLRIWTLAGRVFEQPVPWSSTTIPGSTDFYWAPDISRFGGKWRLYYSVSTFGSNRSAIGLATNSTLDSTRPDYRWKDEGIVFESHRTDDFNAIDPNVAIDTKGKPWLAFGSFWSGIKLVRLDAATGKPAESTPTIHALAERPRGGEIRGAIEAPFIVRHGGFFYLFASFDFCCRGVNSTYNVRVGRSKEITGPYMDRDGVVMLDGGGTRVVWGAGRWRGPGHNAVLHDGSAEWLVYHAYDAEDRGTPKLRIEKLHWSPDGWPEAPSMTVKE
jgi:arabinan endo-1,5-alpha-L-arabinosidase